MKARSEDTLDCERVARIHSERRKPFKSQVAEARAEHYSFSVLKCFRWDYYIGFLLNI